MDLSSIIITMSLALNIHNHIYYTYFVRNGVMCERLSEINIKYAQQKPEKQIKTNSFSAA